MDLVRILHILKEKILNKHIMTKNIMTENLMPAEKKCLKKIILIPKPSLQILSIILFLTY